MPGHRGVDDIDKQIRRNGNLQNVPSPLPSSLSLSFLAPSLCHASSKGFRRVLSSARTHPRPSEHLMASHSLLCHAVSIFGVKPIGQSRSRSNEWKVTLRCTSSSVRCALNAFRKRSTSHRGHTPLCDTPLISTECQLTFPFPGGIPSLRFGGGLLHAFHFAHSSIRRPLCPPPAAGRSGAREGESM